MVLKDIIDDYQFVDSKFNECKDYFEKCQAVIDSYFQNTSAASAKYFAAGNNDTTRCNFVSEMSNEMAKCFSLITKLNSSAYTFYACLGVLTSRKYNLNLLSKEISDFHSIAKTAITSTNNIIEEQLEGMKKKNLLVPFLNSLQELLHIYHSLRGRCALLLNVEMELLEPLPTGIDECDLSIFEMRSYNTNLDFSVYAQDLQLLSRFITQFSSIVNNTPIYMRKIESGSLRIVWSGGEIEISCIADIVNALVNAIRTLAFLPTDIKLKKQEVEKVSLENESIAVENVSRKLAIINSQIDIIAEKLSLDKNNPEDKEKIQQLCTPLIEYLDNNPLGSINGIKYDLNRNVKYITVKE